MAFSPEPALSTFAQAIGADSVYQDAFRLERGGVTFDGRANRGSKGALLGVALTAHFEARVTSMPITLRRERGLDRLGKRLRINREFAAGDDAFDAAVYIEADVPDATLARILGTAEVLRAVEDALRRGSVQSILINATGGLVYDVPKGRFKEPSDVLLALDTAATLVRALEEIPRREVGGYRDGAPFVPEPPLPPRRTRGYAVLAYVAVLVLYTWLSHPPPTFDDAPARFGMKMGAAVAVLHLGLLAALFRGRSTSLRNVLAWEAILAGALVYAGRGAALWANAAFDHGPRTTTRCELSVVNPRKGSPYIRATLPDGTWAKLDLPTTTPIRDPVVTLGKGALDGRWIAAVDPVGPPRR